MHHPPYVALKPVHQFVEHLPLTEFTIVPQGSAVKVLNIAKQKLSIDYHFPHSVMKMIIKPCLAHHLFCPGDECLLSADTPEGWNKPTSFIHRGCALLHLELHKQQNIRNLYSL